jgi:hypothetical protein
MTCTFEIHARSPTYTCLSQPKPPYGARQTSSVSLDPRHILESNVDLEWTLQNYLVNNFAFINLLAYINNVILYLQTIPGFPTELVTFRECIK